MHCVDVAALHPVISKLDEGDKKERLICTANQARLVSDPPGDGISVGLLKRMNGVGLAAEGILSIPQIRDRGHRETNVVGRNPGNEAGDAHSWSRPFTRFISGRDVGSGRIWGRRRRAYHPRSGDLDGESRDGDEGLVGCRSGDPVGIVGDPVGPRWRGDPGRSGTAGVCPPRSGDPGGDRSRSGDRNMVGPSEEIGEVGGCVGEAMRRT
uniref:Uncharacterized protein n=1 Tax=Peronospora matthiolae TaxID=2874970 RepID=A0AAV1VFG8_9STRA